MSDPYATDQFEAAEGGWLKGVGTSYVPSPFRKFVDADFHLAEIERLKAYARLTEDTLARREDEVRRLKAERDEARQQLDDLLARIHRDGGHYTGQVGVQQSVYRAHQVVADTHGANDDLRTRVAELEAERDEAREIAEQHRCEAIRKHNQLRARSERYRARVAKLEAVLRRVAQHIDHARNGGPDGETDYYLCIAECAIERAQARKAGGLK